MINTFPKGWKWLEVLLILSLFLFKPLHFRSGVPDRDLQHCEMKYALPLPPQKMNYFHENPSPWLETVFELILQQKDIFLRDSRSL